MKGDSVIADLTPRSEVGTSDDSDGTGDLNRSALRAASLLIAAGNHPDGATAAELALEANVPRPTAFRLLLSLAHVGLLSRSGHTFSLGWRAAQLGRLANQHRAALSGIQSILEGIASEVHESIEYTVFTSSHEQETIAEASGNRLLAPSQRYIGRGFPLHASATGKVLLAHMTEGQIRSLIPPQLESFTPFTIVDREALISDLHEAFDAGVFVSEDELEVGLYVLAVPVRDASGNAIGGLSASGLTQRMKDNATFDYTQILRDGAAAVGDLLLKLPHNGFGGINGQQYAT